MIKYIGKRLLQSLLTLFIIVNVVFFLMRLMPEEGYFGEQYDKMDEQQIEAALQSMGLRDPIPVQLLRYYDQLLHFNFGKSITVRPKVDISKIIMQKAPYSIRFGVASVLLSLVVGIPMGTVMALKKGKAADKLGNGYIVIINAVPAAVYYLFIQLYGSGLLSLDILYNERKAISALLPIVSMSLGGTASYAMWTRRYVVDQLNKDYVKFARAKGNTERHITFGHMLRNALVPMTQNLPANILLTISGSIYIAGADLFLPGDIRTAAGRPADGALRSENQAGSGKRGAVMRKTEKLEKSIEERIAALGGEELLFSRGEYDPNMAEMGGYSDYSYWRSTVKSFLKNRLALCCLILLVILLLFTVIQPFLPGQHTATEIFWNENNRVDANHPPDEQFIFGTNSIGQDLWARIWSGTRTSLFIGVCVAACNALIGILVGALWGYVRSLDRLLTEVYNVIHNIPRNIILILVSYLIRPGVGTIIFAMCITGWLPMSMKSLQVPMFPLTSSTTAKPVTSW